MSLLWRRGAISAFALLGCLSLALGGWRVSAVSTDPMAWAWIGYGTFLLLGSLSWYDGRRLSHVLIYSLAAGGLAASMHFGTAGLEQWVPVVVAGLAAACGLIAWVSRERDAPPSLANYYAAGVKARRVRESEAQLEIVASLDVLSLSFLRYERKRRLPWAFLLSPPQGVYLHGPAGRGKSFLLDGMYDTCPSRSKRRFHFHDLAAGLTDGAHRFVGDKRALARTARSLAPRGNLVFIDEVNVLDPATAQLFMRLMMEWWRYGCVVCVSSNQSPETLFAGVVLESSDFSQFLAKLLDRTQVVELSAGEDYRLKKLSAQDLYQHPVNEGTQQRLGDIVDTLAEDPLVSEPVRVNGRNIVTLARATGIAWFRFNDLCGAPLSYRDYLQLTDDYPNIVISDVPYLQDEDLARRFAWLVEIVYDRRKRLILSAHAPLDALFAPDLSFRGTEMDFVKIRSRLVEMQSSEYAYSLASEE